MITLTEVQSYVVSIPGRPRDHNNHNNFLFPLIKIQSKSSLEDVTFGKHIVPENNFISSKSGILDLQNLLKTVHLDDSQLPGPNFTTLDQIKTNFIEVIKRINNYGIDLNKIYLVFKSFNFIDQSTKIPYSYHEITKLILWLCHEHFKNWISPKIILVESLDKNDKEVDDRALFILYKALLDLKESPLIFSNDNFNSIFSNTDTNCNLTNQLAILPKPTEGLNFVGRTNKFSNNNKPVNCTFYSLSDFNQTDWIKSKIIVDKFFCGSLSYGEYIVVHPYRNHNAGHKIIILENNMPTLINFDSGEPAK